MTVSISLSLYDFERAFRDMNRDYYSHEAYQYLYEMLDELDGELDVIAICCDWTEYEPDEILTEYGNLVSGDFADDEEKVEALLEKIDNETFMARLENGNYLIQAF